MLENPGRGYKCKQALVHQTDPVAMIHQAANAVRPGGIIAFQEPALQLQAQALPTVDLLVCAEHAVSSVSRALLPHYDVSGGLIRCFKTPIYRRPI